MHRFYFPQLVIQKDTITIVEPRAMSQITRVLRMKPGDEFCVFDDEKEWKVRLLEIERRSLVTQVVEPIVRSTEPLLKVSLYQAIPKKPALFEWVIEKATELGVTEIYPLVTERTEKRRMGKFERMRMIAIESTEQSRRTRVPVIHHPVNLEDALPKMTNGYLAYEYQEKTYLSDYGQAPFQGEVQIIIGPEGGLSQKEVQIAEKAGIKPFTLGPRILRTETAGIVALGILFVTGRQ